MVLEDDAFLVWLMTFLDATIQSFNRAGEYNRDDQVAPAVVLWPDKERQWEPLLAILRERLPHLLTLGPYAANSGSGPAIWLRCMIARTLPEVNWPEKTIPTFTGFWSDDRHTSYGQKIQRRGRISQHRKWSSIGRWPRKTEDVSTGKPSRWTDESAFSGK